MSASNSVSPKLVERLSAWRGTSLFHAREGRSLRGVVLRLLEGDQRRAREVVLTAMHRAITVSHPVIDLALPESDSGAVSMVSDIWPGQLLEQRLLEGPLALGRALDVTRNLAAGLAALHQAGLVHGGVHPANVWLAEDGAVRLLGLGLAAADSRHPSALEPSVAAYLAPEVLRGQEATPAADVWSLAVVFRECLTGRRAFVGDSASQVMRTIHRSPPPPLGGELPEDVERFFERAFKLQPEDRLPCGEEAHRALLEVPDQLPIDPTRPLEIDFNDAPAEEGVAEGPVAIGAKLQGYEITQKLGSGGMGIVYRARDLRLGRDVALKFLPVQLGDRQRRADFESEARAASALDHPNIGTIFGIDDTPEGDTYISMACYDRPNLAQRLDHGPLPVEQALEIAEQVASGLAAAHEHGILHRDIKPGNILFGRDGLAKIVDFGLSRIAEPGSRVVDSEELYGTLGYVPPEVLRNEPFDARADIWSLGVVLYEMISGRKPFLGGELTHLLEVLEREPPRLSTIVPDAPPELDDLVAKALAKDPKKRYRHAAEMAADLRGLRVGEMSGEEWLATWPVPLPRRRLWAAGLTAILALLASAGFFAWRLGAPTRAPDLPAAMVGFQTLDTEPWIGLALEELLRLEIERAGPRVALVAPARASAILGRMDADNGWPRETLESLEEEHSGAIGGVVRQQGEGRGAASGHGSLAAILVHQSRGSSTPRTATALGTAGDLPALARRLALALEAPSGEPPTSRPAPEHESRRLPVPEGEVGRLLEEAREHLHRLDSPQALVLTERGLELADTPRLRLLQANALWDLGRESEAVASLTAAEQPRLPRLWHIYLHAKRYDFNRDYPRAAALHRALWQDREAAARAAAELPPDAVLDAATAMVKGSAAPLALELLERQGRQDALADLVRAEAYHWLSRFDEQRKAVERAIGKAQAADLPFVLARSERQLSSAAWRSGDLEQGLEAARKAADRYRQLGHVKGQADAATAAGIVLYERGDLVLAKDSYDRAARLYASIGNQRAEARTLTNKALVLQQQGDVTAHLEVTERALELLRAGDDKLAELITQVNLTAPLMVRGRFEEAEASFRRALLLARQVERFVAWVESNYGAFLVRTGRTHQARQRLERALGLQAANDDQIGHAESTASMALLLYYQGDLREAQDLFDRALPVLDERGPPAALSSVLRLAAEVSIAGGDLRRAGRYLERASSLDAPRLERSLLDVEKARLLLTRGDLEEANEAALEALAELELRGADLYRVEVLGLLAEIAFAQGDPLLAIERARDGRRLLDSTEADELPLTYSAPLELIRLRALAAGGDSTSLTALQSLFAKVVAEGLVHLELSTRLALADAELHAGHRQAGRERLEELIAEAELKGFADIAGRARELSEGTRAEAAE